MRRALGVLLLAAALLGLGGCAARTSAPPASPSPTESPEPTAAPPAEAGTDALKEKWEACFFGGAEGQNEAGERFYLAYDDPEEMRAAALIILDAEGCEILNYVLGEVETEGDTRRIHDVEEEISLPFTILETEREDGFDLRFRDGDIAAMRRVDAETIIADMLGIVRELG